jgi:molybdate transport system substrate-binding protein
MKGMIGAVLATSIAIAQTLGSRAQGSEVSLLSALVMKPALTELVNPFERTTGHKLTIAYEAAGVVRTRIQSGEVVDVTIIQKPVVEALVREGKIAVASNVTLARSGVAVAVPQGQPKPDVSSVDSLKRALLAAKSVAYADPTLGHASGIHFRSVIERLGIANEVNAKAKYMKTSFAAFIATDSAELSITQPMEILATPGYELAGWLPSELQDHERFTWAVGVTANAKEPVAAKALVQFLISPAAAAVIKAKGMEPGAQ